MTVAQEQGRLWGERSSDYAELVEGAFRPLFEAVYDRVGVAPGTRVLDVGCATGLASRLAAARGAAVAGLDAAEASIAIARRQLPDGDFRVGDMLDLPWPRDSFDLVTGFNSFQFAPDIVAALREAARVARPGGQVAMAVWGLPGQVDLFAVVGPIVSLLPPAPANGSQEVPLSTPGRMEQLCAEAGLRPRHAGDVRCDFNFPDLETALRGILSAGGVVAVIEHAGEARVRRVASEGLQRFRDPDGRYLLSNTLRYVIAAV